MAETVTAPVLVETLERLLDRERRRRRDAALRRAIVATSVAAFVAAAWRIADRLAAREPMPLAGTLALVAFVALVGTAFVLRGAAGTSETDMAREVDRRLELDDRAVAALAIVRGTAKSRLAQFVVRDAESTLREARFRVEEAFPAKAAPRATAPARWSGRAAVVAVVLAVLAELVGHGGPLHLLPGVSPSGGTPRPAPASKESPGGGREDPEHTEEKGPGAPEAQQPEEPVPPKPQGDIRVAMKMAKDEFGEGEPVAATVAATATGEIDRSRTFDVRVSVDGNDVDTGAELTVDPARPQGDRAEMDLRKVPGVKLPPGEHVARARLTTRTTHEEHASEPVRFRIRAPDDKKDDDKDKGGAPPKPKPKPQPQPQPPPERSPESKSGEEKKTDDPAAQAPPPPAQTDRHVVTPLFGEGETVRKKGLILVLDPGGGTATPPAPRPLGDALPDAKRRAEAAVDNARVPEADRELVRRYFELLEGLRK